MTGKQTHNALEKKFQRRVILEIRRRLPGAIVGKVDFIQGIPDLLILYNKHWAMLECKRSATASHRPNQDFYVALLNRMSFARFIYPENFKEVLDELCEAFRD